MLGFLKDLDFSGFGSLGDTTLSPSDLIAAVKSSLPWGVSTILSTLGITDDQIVNGYTDPRTGKNVPGIATLQSMGYSAVQAGSPPANALSSDQVVSIVNGYRDNPMNAATSGILASTLNNLNAKGIYIVRSSNQSVSPTASSAPVSSGGGFWSQIASAPASVAAAITGQTYTQRSPPSVRTIKRPAPPMSVASKNRLYWMLGLGGLLFVVAIVAIAAKD